MRKFWNVSFFGDGELMVTEAIWLLLQYDQLRYSWLAAKNFDGVLRHAEKNGFSFS